MPKASAAFVGLFAAALLVLIGFGFWTVAASVLLLIAGVAVLGSSQNEKVQKLESRIGVVQTGNEESLGKMSKAVDSVAESVNFLRDELKRVAGAFENRLAAVELPRSEETQKYYDLVQKVIDLENRVGVIQRGQMRAVASD